MSCGIFHVDMSWDTQWPKAHGISHSPMDNGGFLFKAEAHVDEIALVKSSPRLMVILPSGNHTKNGGKSPFLMVKLTINGHVH